MLSGRTALVTGSAAGIGLAIAEALAAAGAQVALHGLEPEAEGGAEARRLAAAHGVRCRYERADLADPQAVAGLAARVAEALGPPLILVNNAVTRHFRPVEEMQDAEWEAALAVNLSAPFRLARALLPGMRRAGWGRILNLSSIYGQRAAAGRVDYVTTKTALLGLTRAIAVETARTGITCNAVCPGAVAAPSLLSRIDRRAEAQGMAPERARAAYVGARHPTGAFVTAEDVAAIAVFLCGRHSGNITGASWHVDGGWQAA